MQLRKVIDGLHSNAVRAHYIDKAARALAQSDKEASQVAKSWENRVEEVVERSWVVRSKEKTQNCCGAQDGTVVRSSPSTA